MFGPFRNSALALGGYLWKNAYKMSQSRKRHIRERLKCVENTMKIINSLGINIKALDRANMIPRYSCLSSVERYTFYSTKYKTRLPVRFFPHYSKVEIPTTVPYIEKKGAIKLVSKIK